MVKINGQMHATDGMTITAYLASVGYASDMVAVELNGEIVARDSFDTVRFADGDTAEIVRFVGGG